MNTPFSFSTHTLRTSVVIFGIVLALNLQNEVQADTQFGLNERPSNPSCVAMARPASNASVKLKKLAGGAIVPTAMAQSPIDRSLWYVTDKQGLVIIYKEGDAFAQLGTALDITDRVSSLYQGKPYGELGLLGIALHSRIRT